MRGTETQVVHVRHAYDILISRHSVWGNPFVIGMHGDRAECLRRYEAMWRDRLRNDAQGAWWDALRELRGYRLGCHCVPLACHGHMLVKLIEELELIYE